MFGRKRVLSHLENSRVSAPENVTVGFGTAGRYGLRRIAQFLFPGELRNTLLRWSGVGVAEGVFIGDGVRFVDGFREGIHLGSRVVVSPGVTIVSLAYPSPTSHPSVMKLAREGDVHLEFGCWIGAGAVLLPGVTVGANAVVGAGSVVTRPVPSNEVWAGVPAKFLRRLDV